MHFLSFYTVSTKTVYYVAVFDLVYLLQIFINFQNEEQFEKPHNIQISKLSPILKIDQDL